MSKCSCFCQPQYHKDSCALFDSPGGAKDDPAVNELNFFEYLMNEKISRQDPALAHLNSQKPEDRSLGLSSDEFNKLLEGI